MSESQEIEQVLEVVQELPETVDLKSGKQVTLYKCKVQHLGTVLSFLSFVLEELEIGEQKGIVGLNLKNPTVLLQLFAKASDRMIEVAEVLCSLDKEEIEVLELDDAAELFVGIWNLNQLFFSRQVLPKIPFLEETPIAEVQEPQVETQTAESQPPPKPQEIEPESENRRRRKRQ